MKDASRAVTGEAPALNRAERRRRGLTTARLAKSGRLASAGVLLSVGLFGAYAGNPRLPRAYATTPCLKPSATPTPVTNQSQLIAALQSATTCIEVQGTISLNANLPRIDNTYWTGDRTTYGVTIFGTGDDTIDGASTHKGVDFQLTSATHTGKFKVSDLTMTHFHSTVGAALYFGWRASGYGADVELDDVNLVDNYASSYGAAMYLRSQHEPLHFTVSDSTITDNASSSGGGAIYAFSDNGEIHAEFNNSYFFRNTSYRAGGAVRIYADNGAADASICGSNFWQNSSANREGGALSLTAGSSGTGRVDIFHGNECGGIDPSTFTENGATTGGAISSNGSVRISGNSTFTTNNAVYNGGGAVNAHYVDVTDDTYGSAVFNSNAAVYSSGGAINAPGGASIVGAVFTGNAADYQGGAIYSGPYGTLHIDRSTFDLNVANLAGGAIYSRGQTDITSSSVIRNIVDYPSGKGGGIALAGAGPLTVSNSFIGGNKAFKGAGIDVNVEAVVLQFSTVYDDTVLNGSSRPVEIVAGDLTVVGSAIGNSTSTNVFEASGTVDDSFSVATLNTADDSLTGPGSGEVPMDGLDLGPLSGTDPGERGRRPADSSVLVLASGGGGYAPATNPLPSITRDQVGALRATPFTIGARQVGGFAVPTVSSVTPNSGPTTGGTPVSVTGTGFTGATDVMFGATAATSFTVVDDTTITATTPAAGAIGAVPVSVTGPGGTGTLNSAFTFAAPSPPSPSTPSAPLEVSAFPGVQSAEVTWTAPASPGSFPLTDYEVTSSPEGRTCLVSAPALTCTIDGLAAGTSYTFTVRALNAAGWGTPSEPSNPVIPTSPQAKSILITGSRSTTDRRYVVANGSTTGLVGDQVTPQVKLAGQTSYTPGTGIRTVDAQGRFVWQRKTGKKVYVFFISRDTRSNRVIIEPR